MALTKANARVAVTGAIYVGDYGSTAPTDASTAPDAAFTDLGYSDDSGVEFTPPGGGDSTTLKAWQNGDVLRTIRTASEDSPTWHFFLAETKLEVVELYLGVTVTQTVTSGSFEYTVTDPSPKAFILDVLDGAEIIRHYIPNGRVTDLGSQTFVNTDLVKYDITISGDVDPTAGFNFQGFYTGLKSA